MPPWNRVDRKLDALDIIWTIECRTGNCGDRRFATVVTRHKASADVDRAQAEAATSGFAKIITRGNGEILGAHIVGASAGELIHQIVLAMSHKLKVSALGGIYVYPTLAEINSKAALQFTKQKYAKNHTLQTFLEKFFRFRRTF